MNNTDKNIAQLTLIARDLTGADYGSGYENPEYVRGQVELMLDFCGVGTLYDSNKDLFTRMIADEKFLTPSKNMMSDVIAQQSKIQENDPELSNSEAWVIACMSFHELILEDEQLNS